MFFSCIRTTRLLVADSRSRTPSGETDNPEQQSPTRRRGGHNTASRHDRDTVQQNRLRHPSWRSAKTRTDPIHLESSIFLVFSSSFEALEKLSRFTGIHEMKRKPRTITACTECTRRKKKARSATITPQLVLTGKNSAIDRSLVMSVS